MSVNTTNNRTIAKNTVALYIKLIVSIIINFVSARLILDALGANDYGLYNVVGGVVAMLNVLGVAMIATSYRYMAVEIGKGESGNPNKIYNTVFLVHILLAIAVMFIGETLGVFYINNYLNVELGKIDDALFVLHFSLITCAINVVTVPINGLIIAREKFIYTSVIEIIYYSAKMLCVVFLLYVSDDKLRMYAVMMAVCQLILPIAYQIYCNRTDQDVIKWHFNKVWYDYKEVLIFAFWIFIGAFSSIVKMQGAALIINIFFGTLLNAAFGLASQINGATTQFTTTLRQAVIPQIMKGYASGNEERSLELVYRISRYSYLLMLIPSLPIIICINGVLKIWLGNPPEYTSIFIVLMLINGIVANLCAGFDATIQASGKIRKNQIGFSLINLSLLPIIYLLYQFGFPPYVNTIAMIFLSLVIIVFQCYIMKDLSAFKVSIYIKRTIIPSIATTIVVVLPLLFIISWANASIMNTLISAVLCVTWTTTIVFILGLDKSEKNMLKNIVLSKIGRK